MSEISGFSKHGHIRDSKYPLELGGGWGLFVFHKYFLVIICFIFSGGSTKKEDAVELYVRAANQFKIAKNWASE